MYLQILLNAPARSYEPGLYDFPFRFKLPRNLVQSYRFQCSAIGKDKNNIQAEATYTLTVRAPISGIFTANLSYALELRRGDRRIRQRQSEDQEQHGTPS